MVIKLNNSNKFFVDKTIENIKSCLDEIYDNLPKTEYQEGTLINLGVTSKGKLDYDNGVVGIGQSEQAILPSEYQQVEYIEGTGTQWFEIDYVASYITNSKGKFQITDTSTATFLFGSRVSSTEKFYGFNWGGGEPYKYYNSYNMADGKNIQYRKRQHIFPCCSRVPQSHQEELSEELQAHHGHHNQGTILLPDRF